MTNTSTRIESNAFSSSRVLLDSDPKESLKQFRRGLKSKDNNIIDWRSNAPLLEWLERRPETLIDSLRTLWDDKVQLEARFTSFCESLKRKNIKQTGKQLAIALTLLMALAANDHPPVKTESFLTAMRLAGWKTFSGKQTASEKYQLAREFMYFLLEKAPQYGVELRDLLDAQGVVWCVSGGWPEVPVPTDWANDPEHRKKIQRLIYSAEFHELQADPRSSNLTNTQKLTLVQARRGQGRFREQLVKLWSCCSVEG